MRSTSAPEAGSGEGLALVFVRDGFLGLGPGVDALLQRGVPQVLVGCKQPLQRSFLRFAGVELVRRLAVLHTIVLRQ